MNKSSHYGGRFYRRQSGSSSESAKIVVPAICKLFNPKSVLDVGCGIGTWGVEFKANGVARVCGIDGPWVNPAWVLLSPAEFVAVDFLRGELIDKVLVGEKFDLTVSFEVLEHIDKGRADSLVQFMTSKSDVVIVGAAPPGQGGRNHVNEQWPSYWIELFAKHGFVPFDILRALTWQAPNVDAPYIQNPIVYFRGAVPPEIQTLGEKLAISAMHNPRDIVHPAAYLGKARKLEQLRMRSVSGIWKRIFRR
jgi:SAM-dependent methyltransferase